MAEREEDRREDQADAEHPAQAHERLRLALRLTDTPETDDGEELGEESKVPKLFTNTLSNAKALNDFLSKVLLEPTKDTVALYNVSTDCRDRKSALNSNAGSAPTRWR